MQRRKRKMKGKKKSYAKGGATRKMQMGGAAMPMPMQRTGTMGPRRMMGGGSMKKKSYAQGGKVIKGPYS
jgi:hypothetical protein